MKTAGQKEGADDAIVLIEYGTVPNANTRVGGFLPMVYVNGKGRGDTCCRVTYDAADALALAKAEAQEEAARYLGDWKITVSEAPETDARKVVGSNG